MNSFYSILLISAVATPTLASYAPYYIPCTSNVAVRSSGSAQTLPSAEIAYIQGRKQEIKSSAAFRSYLGKDFSTVFGSTDESKLAIPTLGVALSGGGMRAALYGAGVLSALDSRNSSIGLLQATSYISALSGGSWALSSFVFSDMMSIQKLVLGENGSGGWNLDIDLTAPGSNTVENLAFIATLLAELAEKRAAGFPVSLGDFWARVLAYKFLPGTTAANYQHPFDSTHGNGITFSSATQLSSYLSHQLPFPILLSTAYSPSNPDNNGALPGVPLSGTLYETTPIEFGSYDAQLASHIPTENLGTRFDAGSASDYCVTNFDQASFILGASANLFHFYNVSQDIEWTNSSGPLTEIRNVLSVAFGLVQPNQQLDVSAVPNPFFGIPGYEDAKETQLRLVDGGMNGEGDAVLPLLLSSRGIDTIIIADANSGLGLSDGNSPTGFPLIALQNRKALLPAGTQSLPPLPSTIDVIVAQNLTTRPVFFGCRGSPEKLNGVKNIAPYPFFIYLPNYSATTDTNITQLTYSREEVQSFLNATIHNVQRPFEMDWETCLKCASVERVRATAGVDRTATCSACFTHYCFRDGSETASPSSKLAISPRRRV